MKNWISEGRSLDFIAPAGGVVSGVPILMAALIVIPSTTAAEGVAFAGDVEGVFEVPAATGQAWSATGTLLYWDDTNKRFTTTVGSNTKKAVAAAPKASGDAVGWAKLIQTL
jgi:predicted RecA/RadA family phage recombinase